MSKLKSWSESNAGKSFGCQQKPKRPLAIVLRGLKGSSNRIKKSSPPDHYLAERGSGQSRDILGEDTGTGQSWQKGCGECGGSLVSAEKPKTNTRRKSKSLAGNEVLSEKFYSQRIIGIKSSWKVNVYTRTYRWRWAKKRCKNYENIVTSAQQQLETGNRKDRKDENGPRQCDALPNRTIAGGNQNNQLSVSFRLTSNCKRNENPKKGWRTLDTGQRLWGRTVVRGFARQINTRTVLQKPESESWR